ncbi:MAG: hypothetical protein QOH35_3783 [Acidobacteriaceae bacterium]|jgi:hypothetical protein|nr:hypothetical protein [Acidobacteriaceae bacterium]
MAHKALKAHTSPRRNLSKRTLSSLSSLSSHIFCVEKSRYAAGPRGSPAPNGNQSRQQAEKAEFYKLLSTPSNKRLITRRNIDNPAHRQRGFLRFLRTFRGVGKPSPTGNRGDEK